MKTQFEAAFSAMYVLFGLRTFPSFIAMLNPLAIGVIERTREVGMIRAAGATRGQIGAMVTAEALLLAAIIPARQASQMDIIQALHYE